MTIQGAMNELINLLKADDIPIYYKGGIKKVIETIDDYIDGKDDYVKRKTENSSEKPNNCEPQYETGMGTLKCDNCSEYGSFKCTKCDGEMYYKYDKDEPQTCSVNGRPYDCGNCEYHKCTADEPQTERPCDNCQEFDCYGCEYKQTERSK